MKRWYLYLFFIVCTQTFLAQEKDFSIDEEPKSLFTDFRITMRENINESDLRYNGWKTDAGMYTFRCRKRKRIRLTLWYLDKGPEKQIGSTFVNITPAVGKCQKKDLKYNSYHLKDEF